MRLLVFRHVKLGVQPPLVNPLGMLTGIVVLMGLLVSLLMVFQSLVCLRISGEN